MNIQIFGTKKCAETRKAQRWFKERSIKLPVVNAADHPQAIGAAKFAELVEQKSGGKIKIRVYPGGVLGGEQQVASAMQGGTVEASMMGPAQLVGHIKEFMVGTHPIRAPKRCAQHCDGPAGLQIHQAVLRCLFQRRQHELVRLFATLDRFPIAVAQLGA